MSARGRAAGKSRRPVQHRLPRDKAEAKRYEVGMDVCVWCSLVQGAWEREPDCEESDPLYRRASGYELREKKDPWEGSGFRVLKPWMVGPDEGRYGHAFKGFTVVDLVGVIRSLDGEQKDAFMKLIRSSEIEGIVL